jgi:D-serine dehydratase
VNDVQDLLDPTIDASSKGFPHGAKPLRRSQIGAQGWSVLAGDLPLPLAVVKQEAVRHNVGWMQRFAGDAGIDIAPHGKTTMSPQMFKQQLDAGAWGLSFATVHQAGVGVAAGARNCIIANQVISDIDLLGILSLRRKHAGVRIVFLLDSLAQLALIESCFASHPGEQPFDVLLEIGVMGGRTGCRNDGEAMTLGERAHASTAVSLSGIECYEGLAAKADTDEDAPYADALMQRVHDIAVHCDRNDWFDTGEVIVSAGGSAIFDLVATRLKPQLKRTVRGLLRSGCYVTHDHGFYRRMLSTVGARLNCQDNLHPALEVWASVQSLPEPGLAILAVGKRDISYDLELPIPIGVSALGSAQVNPSPEHWRISGMNDQHAYLRWDQAQSASLRVGDRVVLGISHPCTTFDKWRWMPVVDSNYRVVDALVTWF